MIDDAFGGINEVVK